jgi:hypothetical protein
MKTIIEIINENKSINECGGQIFVGGGCGGGQWVNASDYYWQQQKEKKKKAKRDIPADVVKDYISKVKEYNKIRNSENKANADIYTLTNEIAQVKFSVLGIEGVAEKLTSIIKNKQTYSRTFTQTLNIIKMIAYLLSEEYDEGGMDDPKLKEAFTKILDELK